MALGNAFTEKISINGSGTLALAQSANFPDPKEHTKTGPVFPGTIQSDAEFNTSSASYIVMGALGPRSQDDSGASSVVTTDIVQLVDSTTMDQKPNTQDKILFLITGLTPGENLTASYPAIWVPGADSTETPKNIIVLVSDFDGGQFDGTVPNRNYNITIEKDGPGMSDSSGKASDSRGGFEFSVIGVQDIVSLNPSCILAGPGRLIELEGSSPSDQ